MYFRVGGQRGRRHLGKMQQEVKQHAGRQRLYWRGSMRVCEEQRKGYGSFLISKRRGCQARGSIPSSTARTHSPSSPFTKITPLPTLKTSSPSYPRARFFPFLLMLVVAPSSGADSASCFARIGTSVLSSAFTRRLGMSGEWVGWVRFSSEVTLWRRGRR
jgi:hypothetical protein